METLQRTTIANSITAAELFTSPNHFYYRRLGSHKELLQGKRNQHLTVIEVLGTAEGAQAFFCGGQQLPISSPSRGNQSDATKPCPEH